MQDTSNINEVKSAFLVFSSNGLICRMKFAQLLKLPKCFSHAFKCPPNLATQMKWIWHLTQNVQNSSCCLPTKPAPPLHFLISLIASLFCKLYRLNTSESSFMCVFGGKLDFRRTNPQLNYTVKGKIKMHYWLDQRIGAALS